MKDSAAAKWKQIEISESYLVCSMYEEAASLASTILKQRSLHDDDDDMVESSAMVLLQAFNQLGRTSEIVNQLGSYFISPKAIPPQLLLTGVCFQLAQGSTFGVREFLEEFLNGWTLSDGQYHYHAVITEPNGLLRRLHSMHSLKTTISSQVVSLRSHTNNNEGSSEALKGKHADDKTYRSKDGVSKLSERIATCFWCFRSINLKVGNAKFVIPSGKIMLGCLILFVCYVFRRKHATLKRIVRRQVIATKRALGDLWQLAFSYEVDPLAAVQPLAAAAYRESLTEADP
ncbi:hypothetical protein TSUD_144050 [Trifolium subterraneum]|uniref:Uncharacterized protein n=1 Tax=Trifolium subterraneum TaxID=3900 RepID=A0A2Z6NM99_TRISU|nr:hypothetical protein TSUD_144050 [Trifolium subterraneum]